MRANYVLLLIVASVCTAPRALAVPCRGQELPVCTWTGGNAGFPPAPRIDFEHLPDGTPSHGGVQITPTFNYTAQGVTFSAPLGNPFIAGFGPGDFGLAVNSGTPLIREWIIADFATPVRGVGVYFPGSTYLSAYDAQGGLIATTHYSNTGGPFFVGITSDVPIARAVMDSLLWDEDIDDFAWVPVPEPTSALLLLIAGAFMLRAGRATRA